MSGTGIGFWRFIANHPHVCACGKAFTGPKNAKYCGNACRKAAFAKQQKAWQAKQKAKKAKKAKAAAQ